MSILPHYTVCPLIFGDKSDTRNSDFFKISKEENSQEKVIIDIKKCRCGPMGQAWRKRGSDGYMGLAYITHWNTPFKIHL